MKKAGSWVSNVGLVLGIIWTLIFGSMAILINPFNADAFYMYSYLLMIVVIKIYLKKVNINNILNIAGLMILNIGTIIIPLTVLYIFGIKIGNIFAIDMFLILPSETSMRYIEFLLTTIKQGSFYTFFLPLFFIICFSIILFSIECLRVKK